MESRPCKTCKGTGITVREAFTYTDSVTGAATSYPRKESTCHSCDGKGIFLPPNESEIMEQIKGRKGLRSAPPKPPAGKRYASRAYYVWRMARFHGGVDMTMPVTASLLVHGDPYLPELDAIADKVAKQCFGTDLAAAKRWGRALGYL